MFEALQNATQDNFNSSLQLCDSALSIPTHGTNEDILAVGGLERER